jgi:hypothetical protein
VDAVRFQLASIVERRDKPTLAYRTEVCQEFLIHVQFLTYSQSFEEHLNLLKISDVPHILSVPPEKMGPIIPRSDPVPWLNMEVLIVDRHPLKGWKAIIKDVLCNQATTSGLKVVISYEASIPFKTYVLDYDNVVDAR